MHRTFKNLLPDARGESEIILAANIDVRGFSSFSLARGSSETVLYLKKIYLHILERFFPDATYFKPAGDGLLVVISFEEETLSETLTTTIQSCLELVKEFKNLCDDDPGIYFATPTGVGIGLSRGEAARLVAKTRTLDYSGRVLNLATRLMELARPSGLVFDETIPAQLLPEELQASFLQDDRIYLKGIAEREPITVFYSTAYTQISDSCHHPLDAEVWESQYQEDLTLRKLREMAPTFIIALDKPALSKKKIQVTCSYPAVSGNRRTEFFEYYNAPGFAYEIRAGEPCVLLDVNKLIEQLEKDKVRLDWEVTLELKYVPVST